MDKWRNYCSDRKTIKKVKIVNEETIVGILCPIEELKSKKIIEKEIFL